MEEKILEYLAKFPGSRRRDIASALHVWVCDKDLMSLMYKMTDEGKIYRILFSDPASMSFYDRWYVA